MKKFLDSVITGFFVMVFGIVWFCSTKYSTTPNQYNIIIYDLLGKEIKLDEIRTNFKTKQVAISYLKEYKSRFQHYDFSIGEYLPEIKKRPIFSIQR